MKASKEIFLVVWNGNDADKPSGSIHSTAYESLEEAREVAEYLNKKGNRFMRWIFKWKNLKWEVHSVTLSPRILKKGGLRKNTL